MPNTSERETRGSPKARAWASETAARFGKAVADARRERGLSAVELSSRTSELGYPITRGSIARIEGNHRAGKVDVAEVVVLAAALNLPPLQLLYPEQAGSPVEYLPGVEVASIDAAEHFAGEMSLPGELSANLVVMQNARRYRHLRDTVDGLNRINLIDPLTPEDLARRDAARDELAKLITEIERGAAPFYWGVPADDMCRDQGGNDG